MQRFLIVVALWAAGLGAAAQFGKISVLYDQLSGIYAAYAGVGVGLIVSVVGFVGLIFGTTAGLLVARIGPRRAILAALILGAAVSAAQSLLPPYPVLIISRVFEGLSHLAIVVVGPTMIAGVATQRWQGLAMTLWSSFFGVTFAILAVIAPGIVAWGGMPAIFLGHAVFMVLVAGGLAVLLPPDPPPPQTRPDNMLAAHQAIYASPSVAAPAMAFVFYTMIYVALLTLLPPMVDPVWRSTVATGMPLISIVLSLTFGVWMLRVVPAVTIVQGGFVLAILAAAGLWAFWGQGAAQAAFALMLAAALGLVQGASFASIPQLNETADARARASGAVAQLGNLGTTTGTPLFVWIIATFGPSGLATCVIALCLTGIAVLEVQRRRRARTS